MRTQVTAAATLTFIFLSTFAAGTTLYVDDDAPNDPGPGDPTVSDPEWLGRTSWRGCGLPVVLLGTCAGFERRMT
jgi:hypothetical protein